MKVDPSAERAIRLVSTKPLRHGKSFETLLESRAQKSQASGQPARGGQTPAAQARDEAGAPTLAGEAREAQRAFGFSEYGMFGRSWATETAASSSAEAGGRCPDGLARGAQLDERGQGPAPADASKPNAQASLPKGSSLGRVLEGAAIAHAGKTATSQTLSSRTLAAQSQAASEPEIAQAEAGRTAPPVPKTVGSVKTAVTLSVQEGQVQLIVGAPDVESSALLEAVDDTLREHGLELVGLIHDGEELLVAPSLGTGGRHGDRAG